MSEQPRRAPSQAVLAVQEVEHVSPELVRITAGGEGYEAFTDNVYTDKYVKILFADPRHGLTPPYDLARLREETPEKLPTRRTYTVRSSDAAQRRLVIDFVVHGDEGVAGPWARRAQIGDTLVLSGAGGGYRPDPEMPWHLLIGDHTALPAISSAIEAMEPDAVGHVILSVADPPTASCPPRPRGSAWSGPATTTNCWRRSRPCLGTTGILPCSRTESGERSRRCAPSSRSARSPATACRSRPTGPGDVPKTSSRPRSASPSGRSSSAGSRRNPPRPRTRCQPSCARGRSDRS